MMQVSVEPRSRMLVRLERETREHHAAADEDLFGIVASPTPSALRRFFATLYHFEYAVEWRFSNRQDLPIRFIAQRIKTGPLGNDLLALGLDAPSRDILAHPLDVPEFASGAAALGWIYVLERSSLRHAALQHALGHAIASKYLAASAATASERWRELGIYVDYAACSPEKERELIDAAHGAFEHQHLWYDTAGSYGPAIQRPPRSFGEPPPGPVVTGLCNTTLRPASRPA
jgi:heme oxygenase